MKYFGTDGIRQKADAFTPEFLAHIVKGLLDYAGDDVKIFLAGDTRESTEWILQDLAIACETYGLEYSLAGVLPTPAINYCFYQMGFDFAIDVTASHNPYTDNGIKIFERGPVSGQKLCDKGCISIEHALISESSYAPASATIGEDLHTEALSLYREHIISYLDNPSFSGIKISLDCANGATSVIAPRIFTELGAAVTTIHADAKYGQGINHDCGSTHLESLISTVTKDHLDFGIAYDGDGDRCLLVDHAGTIVDGDEIIAILANYYNLDKIAVTVMANQGLLDWAAKHHIATEITTVGDSNVAAAMRKKHIELGGEQSGHIILPGEPTGDGILTSLVLTKIIAETGQPLKGLAHIITKFPQVIVNLPATPEQKSALTSSKDVADLLLSYDTKLKSVSGRLLVRPSGTEPLIRITMWGNDEPTIAHLAEDLESKLSLIL